MPNPVEQTQALLDTLNEVIDLKPLGRQLRSELGDLIATVRKAYERLRHIDDEIIDLSVDDSRVADAQTMWAELSPGVHGDTSEELAPLIAQSPTLCELYQAGIELLNVRRFSDQHRAIADAMGNAFRESRDVLDAFRRSVSQLDGKVRFIRKDLDVVMRLFSALRRAGLVADFETELYSLRDKKWLPMKRRRLHHLKNPGQRLRIIYKVPDGYMRSFIEGDWLTAHTAGIVSDHLERNGIDHEIFTMLAYKAPSEIVDDRSDIDVLVRADDHIVLIECKAGRLDLNGSAEGLTSMIDRTAAIETVLRRTIGFEGTLDALLVFDPRLTPVDPVQKRLEGTPIRTVAPEDLRETIHHLFTDEE